MSNAMRRTYILMFLIVGLTLALLTGCANLAVYRNPASDIPVMNVYPGTRTAAVAGMVVAWPQMMLDRGDNGFMAENIFTIPLSLFVFADAICEIPFDTVFLPVDYYLYRKRRD